MNIEDIKKIIDLFDIEIKYKAMESEEDARFRRLKEKIIFITTLSIIFLFFITAMAYLFVWLSV